jgi:hypothetical protein
MTIGTDHRLPRKDQTLLREKGVFNTRLSNFKVMGEVLGFSKFPENLALFCGKNILGRSEVIRNQNDPVSMENFSSSNLFKSLNGKRGSDIIPEGQIDPDIEEFSGRNTLLSGMDGQDLFRDGHRSILCHIIYS